MSLSFSSLLYLSISLSLFVCFIFFLPLTATQQGAISHSAQRGLEELKATEQKKNRKTETGKETGELREERRRAGGDGVRCSGGSEPDRVLWHTRRWRD